MLSFINCCLIVHVIYVFYILCFLCFLIQTFCQHKQNHKLKPTVLHLLYCSGKCTPTIKMLSKVLALSRYVCRRCLSKEKPPSHLSHLYPTILNILWYVVFFHHPLSLSSPPVSTPRSGQRLHCWLSRERKKI